MWRLWGFCCCTVDVRHGSVFVCGFSYRQRAVAVCHACSNPITEPHASSEKSGAARLASLSVAWGAMRSGAGILVSRGPSMIDVPWTWWNTPLRSHADSGVELRLRRTTMSTWPSSSTGVRGCVTCWSSCSISSAHKEAVVFSVARAVTRSLVVCAIAASITACSS